jgi:uncharacterized protein (TIGR00730 family)
MSHLRQICVFAGSSPGREASYVAAARDLGTLLARAGIGIVNGGGRVGLMGALSDAALEAGGRVVGVIPGGLATKELAHSALSELHVVASMHERKAMMAQLSDAFIALPGGLGTLEELFEVATWAQLGIHRKPIALMNVGGYYHPLLAFLAQSVREGFVREDHQKLIRVGNSPGEVLALLEKTAVPVQGPWIDVSNT